MKLLTRILVAMAVVLGLAVPIQRAVAAPDAPAAAAPAAAADGRHGGFRALGARNGFRVDATEDAGAFTDRNLRRYDVVIWLSTTGDVLNDQQQAAFERYINRGGGYAGIHAASDTEYDWAWYGALVGAYFRDHPGSVSPQFQTATIDVLDRRSAATKPL